MQGTSQWSVQVHMSHMISYTVNSEVSFIVSSENPVVTSSFPPSDGSMIETGKAYTITWDPSFFHFFKADNAYIGTGVDTPTKLLSVSLIAGSKQAPTHFIHLKTVSNSYGNTSIVIPHNATALGNRFFIALHDAQRVDVVGTSKGSFSLSGGDVRSTPPETISPINTATGISQQVTTPHTQTQASVTEVSRKLVACPAATLSIGIGAAATFGGFDISAKFPLFGWPEIGTPSFLASARAATDSIMSPIQYCVASPL